MLSRPNSMRVPVNSPFAQLPSAAAYPTHSTNIVSPMSLIKASFLPGREKIVPIARV